MPSIYFYIQEPEKELAPQARVVLAAIKKFGKNGAPRAELIESLLEEYSEGNLVTPNSTRKSPADRVTVILNHYRTFMVRMGLIRVETVKAEPKAKEPKAPKPKKVQKTTVAKKLPKTPAAKPKKKAPSKKKAKAA